MRVQDLTLIERLEVHIFYAPDGCHYWTSRDRKGYGSLSIKHKDVYAHRLSYTVHKGEIPNGMHVLHTCDNPLCVNPDHLFLGTNNDNIADKVRKGRCVVGENHKRSKLTQANVIQIRALCKNTNVSRIDIAAMFGVCYDTVYRIMKNQIWKHVTWNQIE